MSQSGLRPYVAVVVALDDDDDDDVERVVTEEDDGDIRPRCWWWVEVKASDVLLLPMRAAAPAMEYRLNFRIMVCVRMGVVGLCVARRCFDFRFGWFRRAFGRELKCVSREVSF